MQSEWPAGLSLAVLVVEARVDLMTYPGILASTAHTTDHTHACDAQVLVTISCFGSCQYHLC